MYLFTALYRLQAMGEYAAAAQQYSRVLALQPGNTRALLRRYCKRLAF
jgi:hypothetical protein